MSVETEIDWEAIYSALATNNRRTLLEYLLAKGDARPEELSHYLLREDEEVTESDLASAEIRIYHVDLPKLEEANLIEWNRKKNRVTVTPLVSRLPRSILSPHLSSSQTVTDGEEVAE